MSVRLLEITREDLPLIERWLHEDHVRRFWGDPAANARLLREPPAGTRLAVIEAEGKRAGIVLLQHPSREELDQAGLTDVPESVLDLDIMIGEANMTGRGVGSAAIQLAAEAALSDQTVPFVIAATAVDNESSLRAFAKAGFRRDREFDDTLGGRYVLMVRDRARDG